MRARFTLLEKGIAMTLVHGHGMLCPGANVRM
jgi:hypothetical protein